MWVLRLCEPALPQEEAHYQGLRPWARPPSKCAEVLTYDSKRPDALVSHKRLDRSTEIGTPSCFFTLSGTPSEALPVPPATSQPHAAITSSHHRAQRPKITHFATHRKRHDRTHARRRDASTLITSQDASSQLEAPVTSQDASWCGCVQTPMSAGCMRPLDSSLVC